MPMKKVVGVVFIVIGAFLGLSVAIKIPWLYREIPALMVNDSFAAVVVAVLVLVIYIALVYFLLKVGVKWVKSKW